MKILDRTCYPSSKAGALSCLAACLICPSVWGQTSATWSSTATQAISLSNLISARDLGPVATAQPLTVRVALAPQNKAALEALVAETSNPKSPTFGEFLTPAQFAASYGAKPAQVSAVVAYLKNAGFTNLVVEPNNLLVSADGTAAVAAKAFNTKLERFAQFGKTVFGNTAPAQVPAALGGIVTAVLGLNSIGQMKSTVALPATPSLPQYLVSYTPKQFQTIYGAASVAPATNASIAIMAEGDLTGVLKDLSIADNAFGLHEVRVQVVPVGLASTDVSGADEWDMDTQYASGMAGTVREMYLYDTTSLTDSDLALEFSRWATDDKAKAASASLGECEFFPFLDGSMVVDDMTFLEAAAQGQTFFASAGDTGSFCPAGAAGVNGVPAGAPFVSYPASSPYVIGVGGTTLFTNANGTYNREISWYSGGGGLSQFESAPAWQQSAFLLISETADKGVPDLAYDADPNSGATVYVNGAPEAVGGTSLSSPLALGTWARALSINPKLGFAGPALYSLYTGSTAGGSYPLGGFNDITIGTNGLYQALPGFDLTTGLGTPVVSQLTRALAQ